MPFDPTVLQVRRGVQADLPIGASGEPLWTTDTKRLYIGDGVANTLINSVTSVSNSDSTITFSPTTGDVVGSLNLGHANTWTADISISHAHLNISKGNIKFTGETAPTAPTIALVTTGTGNCSNGAHSVRITFITAEGETQQGAVSSNVTVDSTHKQISLSAIPTGTSGVVTGRNVYMSKVVTNGITWFRVTSGTTLADNTTTTLTINIADTSLNAAAPLINTTSGSIFTNGIRRIHIDGPTGNVGIGTFSQAAALEVKAILATFPALIARSTAGQTADTFKIIDATGTDRVRFNDTSAYFYAFAYTSDASFTGSSGSEKFGWNSSVSATDSTAFGQGATANSGGDVAIGKNARTGSQSIAVGESVIADGTRTVALGHGWNTSGNGSVWIGGAGSTATGSNAIGINTYNVTDNGIGIGDSSAATAYATAIGLNNNASGIGSVAMGANSTASGNNNFAIGQSAYNNASSDTALLGYIDTYFGKYQNTIFWPITLHSSDAYPGNPDLAGSDFTIIPGLGNGAAAGGDFLIKQSPAGTPGGTTNNTANEHMHVYAASGKTTFTGELITVASPSAGTGALHYNDNTFTTGYGTDGSTSRDYHLYSYSPAAGGIWSLSATIVNAPFVDDNSTISFPDGPSMGSGTINYTSTGSYVTSSQTIDYQIYDFGTYNGVTLYTSLYATATVTDDGRVVTVPDPTGASATEDIGLSGYSLGDSIDYQVYSKCDFNGTTIFSSSNSPTSVTIVGIVSGVDVAWTNPSYPTNSTNQGVRILRQVNGGGYNDYMDIVDPTVTLNDDASGWTSGSTVTPTSTADLYNVDVSSTNATYPAGSSSNGFLILRQINGGGFVDYQLVGANPFNDDGTGWLSFGFTPAISVPNFYQIDFSWSLVSGATAYKMIRTISGVDDATLLGNTSTFIDTGTLAWADSTTVTPTSGPGFVTSLNNIRTAINVINTGGATPGIPVYSDNATALSGGLIIGDVYRTGGDPDPVCIVH